MIRDGFFGPRKKNTGTPKSANKPEVSRQQEEIVSRIYLSSNQDVLLTSANLKALVHEEECYKANTLVSSIDLFNSLQESGRYTISGLSSNDLTLPIPGSTETLSPLEDPTENDPYSTDSSQMIVKPQSKCEIVNPQTGLLCGRAFKNQGSMTRHQSSSVYRPKKKKIRCTLCSREFVFQTGLRRHTRDKHEHRLDTDLSDKASNTNISDFVIIDDDECQTGLRLGVGLLRVVCSNVNLVTIAVYSYIGLSVVD